jgi:hypothetical protein
MPGNLTVTKHQHYVCRSSVTFVSFLNLLREETRWLLCCGLYRGQRNLWLRFKSDIFYSGNEISVAHSEVTVAPYNLPSFSCGFLETWRGPLRGYMTHSEVTVAPYNLPSFSCGSLETWRGPLRGYMAHAEKHLSNVLRFSSCYGYEAQG